MPGRGEALLTNKIAEVIGVKVGDQIVIEYDDIETVTLTVSGIYRNYVGNYIYITDETYEKDFIKSYEPNVMYVTARDESKVRDVSEGINDFDGGRNDRMNIQGSGGIPVPHLRSAGK